MVNKCWVVAHASHGRYDPSCFRLDDVETGPLPEGKLLVETRFMSLDPTHLNWVKLDPALQFLPIGLGDAMIGTNIGVVRESRHPAYKPGDQIMGTWSWAEVAVADPDLVSHALDEADMGLTQQLTILSHVGQAAAGGMLIVGGVKAGDNVLVSAAAGATGSIAAQIAKAKGCRTFGIAGGPEKCRYLIDELKLDGAIDYRAGTLKRDIANHFPAGVDLFFDNVGGEILDVVLSNMARHCRIVVCGAIAQYDSDRSSFTGIHNLPMLIFRQASMTGYVAGQFGARNAELIAQLGALYAAGSLRAPVHLTSFDQIPNALTLLLTGKNGGKLIAEIA